VPVFEYAPSRGVRRHGRAGYATLTDMQRAASAPQSARFVQGSAGAWLARRWYYTPRTHRAYSVRQISPGDRRLLAEFATSVTPHTEADLLALTTLLFDRVIGDGGEGSVGYVALENTAAGDRVIGVCAYAPTRRESCEFSIAVANSYREEQVGRTLLTTLLRHAKRVGVRRLEGEMTWSNRAMQMLALSMGFVVETIAKDRSRRLLVLGIS
jgi:RimJ/RimL family protein N-acetyltransferase